MRLLTGKEVDHALPGNGELRGVPQRRVWRVLDGWAARRSRAASEQTRHPGHAFCPEVWILVKVHHPEAATSNKT